MNLLHRIIREANAEHQKKKLAFSRSLFFNPSRYSRTGLCVGRRNCVDAKTTTGEQWGTQAGRIIGTHANAALPPT
ncbi:hypothetical protein L1281_000299 [Neisseria sp. HSC-16F19]|nr:hypothetical protein [Neisseria sp. HSC-16F19]